MSELINVTKADFTEQVLQSEVPVIVDFWAAWCGPCKMIAPILADIAGERAGQLKIVKVNIDDAQELAAEYNVRSIPTLLLFVKGSLLQTKVGALNKSQLLSWLDESIGG